MLCHSAIVSWQANMPRSEKDAQAFCVSGREVKIWNESDLVHIWLQQMLNLLLCWQSLVGKRAPCAQTYFSNQPGWVTTAAFACVEIALAKREEGKKKKRSRFFCVLLSDWQSLNSKMQTLPKVLLYEQGTIFYVLSHWLGKLNVTSAFWIIIWLTLISFVPFNDGSMKDAAVHLAAFSTVLF